MNDGAIATLAFIFALAGCIMLPVYLRNLLYRKTLDTVAKAIEHGIDPERIAVQLPSLAREREEDPNGNWKAGVVLLGIALGFLVAITVPVWLLVGDGHAQERFTVLAPPVILGLVGAALLYIHRSIVGPVVRYERKRGRQSAPAGPAERLAEMPQDAQA
ncbi:hypothetical protein IT575_13580 [bacterium]|nr:hypothetical protein [bacterium]